MIGQALVLIVDDELGFVIRLGVTLAENGYSTLPADTASTAQQLIHEVRVTPDLAIVNLELAGTVKMIEALHRANPALKVIAVEDVTPITRPIAVDATHSRAAVDWVATVKRVLDLRNASGAS